MKALALDAATIRAKVMETRQIRSDAGHENLALVGSVIMPLTIPGDRPLYAQMVAHELEYVRWANETILSLLAELEASTDEKRHARAVERCMWEHGNRPQTACAKCIEEMHTIYPDANRQSAPG